MGLRSTFRGEITVYEIRQWVCGEWYLVQPSHKVVGEVGNSFSAGGDCWQRCGIFGTLKESEAVEAYVAMQKQGQKNPIRIFKRTYRVEEENLPDNYVGFCYTPMYLI